MFCLNYAQLTKLIYIIIMHTYLGMYMVPCPYLQLFIAVVLVPAVNIADTDF